MRSAHLDVSTVEPPTTNYALEALRMAGFRAAKMGRRAPVLPRGMDPWEEARRHWMEIGAWLRQVWIREHGQELPSRYRVEWCLSGLWSSRADAGSGWVLAKWLGDGFFGRGGHGDHGAVTESVTVLPATKQRIAIALEGLP